MDFKALVFDFSNWLRDGERWNLITIVICLAGLAYVVTLMIRRARDESRAAQAAASDSSRIASRRYHESAWSSGN
jgi:hypothetical protein